MKNFFTFFTTLATLGLLAACNTVATKDALSIQTRLLAANTFEDFANIWNQLSLEEQYSNANVFDKDPVALQGATIEKLELLSTKIEEVDTNLSLQWLSHEHPFGWYHGWFRSSHLPQSNLDSYCYDRYTEYTALRPWAREAWHVWAHKDKGRCVYNK